MSEINLDDDDDDDDFQWRPKVEIKTWNGKLWVFE